MKIKRKIIGVSLPYNNTAGWSGTDTSKARAEENVYSGREENRQLRILRMLHSNPNGYTWKELSEETGLHHGTVSGILSVLHKTEKIIRINTVRNRCKVYMHPVHVSNQMITEKQGRKNTFCPHCGNDVNTPKG
jgi:hypothetical protein